MKFLPKGTPGFNPGPSLFLIALVAFGTACRQDMHNQPRYEVYEASTFFADGRASQHPPDGTVARGQLREDDALYTGKVDGLTVDTVPFAITHADLVRGQERFNIYCTPCHGRLGDGTGMVVQRGLRQAASYHQDRLRQERIGYFYDVITNGFGAMQGYAEQVPVRDRWLIASYVRALQYSQNASIDDVPADRRGDLGTSAQGSGSGTSAPPGQGSAQGGTSVPPVAPGQPPIKH